MSKLLAGRYELIEKIGEGGMAVVYKGKDRLLNRYVAIKILRPEFTKDTQFIENFRKESQAAAGLQHPNIVSVYDVGQEGNIHFIVMELIDGKPLSDIIKERAPFDYKETIEITKQVASALSLAHKHNIIHRDVKPHNIMITNEGVAKLADFGIAKAVSDSTAVKNETSRIIGSVHYFSPEQARGAYVDERSDIYSLGIVIYEMLTGEVPFDGDNPVQVALMHINNEIIPPSKLVRGIPPALEKLVMKATDKFQANRYRNAEELIEVLKDIDFITDKVGKSVFIATDDNYDSKEPAPEISTPEPKKKKSSKKEKAEKAEEQSEKKDKPKKKNKKTEGKAGKNKYFIIGGIILAVLVIAGILMKSAGVFGGSVVVPNLTNMTQKKAEKTLKELELNVKIGEPVTSDDVKKGRVAAQSPDEGEKVKKGDTVTIILSEGKPTGEVPYLVGRTFDKEMIEALLQANGYVLGSYTEEESESPEGEIISQDPSGGSIAEKDTVVNVVISKGTSKLIVPSLIGLTLEEAKETIVNSKFEVGYVNFEESSVYSKGIVMDAQYKEGDKLEKGASIGIVVSKGMPEVVPEPDPDPEPDPKKEPDKPDITDNQEDDNPDIDEPPIDKPDDSGDISDNPDDADADAE